MNVEPRNIDANASPSPESRGLDFYHSDRSLKALLRLYLAPPELEQMEPHFERLGRLVGGRLDMHVITFSNAQPLLKTNKLLALCVTSKARHPGFPNVPALSEKIVPDYDVVSWLGFTSPTGLPPGVRDRWHEALKQAMARPAIKDKLEELGNDTRVSTPAEFRARVEADMARWRPLAHVVNQS